MASLSVTNAEGVLKVRYPADKVKFLGYEGNPLLSLLPKDESFYGKQIDVPIYFGGNQGRSRVFATAQTNERVGLYEAFNITRRKDYGLTSIELEAVQASMNDAGAFLRLSTTEVDNIIRTVGKNLAVSLYRNFGGARGRLATPSGQGTNTLQLLNIEDVVNFEVGMRITSDNTDGTAGGADDANGSEIGAINRIAGTLSLLGGGNWAATFGDGDYLFAEGDFGVSIDGLDSWVPASAPGATAFNGVDRSVDVTRLGGLRYDGSAESIDEALQSAEILASREGANPSHVFMNHKDFGDLRKSLGSKVIYDMARSPDMPQIGFKSIVLAGSQGDIKVVADRYCPKGVAYMLQMDTWKFYSLGPAPKILSGMGLEFLWKATADAIEVRTGYYGNLACRAPGYNMRVTLPS
jgi:hypothetical protein